MKTRAMVLGAAAAAMIAVPAIAEAAWGTTTGNVNMRTGPSTGYGTITTLPAGAQVWVGGNVNGWYQVTYNNVNGYVSGSYIATGNVMQPPRFQPPQVQPPRFGNPPPRFGNQPPPRFGNQQPPRWVGNRPPPPRSGFWRTPNWDDRYGAWYDGRRWYRNGVWYNSPEGFSFGFSFGR